MPVEEPSTASIAYIHTRTRSSSGESKKKFDILGYYFGPDGLSVAKKAVENFVVCAIRLSHYYDELLIQVTKVRFNRGYAP